MASLPTDLRIDAAVAAFLHNKNKWQRQKRPRLQRQSQQDSSSGESSDSSDQEAGTVAVATADAVHKKPGNLMKITKRILPVITLGRGLTRLGWVRVRAQQAAGIRNPIVNNQYLIDSDFDSE